MRCASQSAASSTALTPERPPHADTDTKSPSSSTPRATSRRSRAQLESLAELGYDGVEPFLPNYGDDPARFRRQIDAAGLACCGFHLPYDGLIADPQRFIDIAQTIGANLLIPPYLPPEARPTDAEGWRAVGHNLAKAAEPVNAAGLRLAWHNHDFEYRPLPDGTRPIDHLLEAAGPQRRLRGRLRLGHPRRRRPPRPSSAATAPACSRSRSRTPNPPAPPPKAAGPPPATASSTGTPSGRSSRKRPPITWSWSTMSPRTGARVAARSLAFARQLEAKAPIG